MLHSMCDLLCQKVNVLVKPAGIIFPNDCSTVKKVAVMEMMVVVVSLKQFVR